MFLRTSRTALLAAWLVAATPLAAQDETGLGAAPTVSDAELAEMRGKFISADSVRFFGVTLHTLWQTGDGVVTAARLGFNVWLGENGGAGPQVVVEWKRDGDPGMNVTEFDGQAAGSYTVTAGAVQTNVIAGTDNTTANRMGVAIVPVSSITSGGTGGNFSGTMTGTAADGDTVTFNAGNGQFGLALTDAQGGGTVRQGISTDPGQLSQSILLDGNGNSVTNTMSVTVGIDRGQIADTVNLSNSISAMQGHGF